MAWDTSTRAARLPSDWRERRARVLKRDQFRCQIAGPDCTVLATEVDHITPGDDHRAENLAAVCHSCHTRKTTGEAQAALAAIRARAKRPAEPHPGLIQQP